MRVSVYTQYSIQDLLIAKAVVVVSGRCLKHDCRLLSSDCKELLCECDVTVKCCKSDCEMTVQGVQ